VDFGHGTLNGKIGAALRQPRLNTAAWKRTVTNVLHFGMTIVGLPYSRQGRMTLNEVGGGVLCGATTTAFCTRSNYASSASPGRGSLLQLQQRPDQNQALDRNAAWSIVERNQVADEIHESYRHHYQDQAFRAGSADLSDLASFNAAHAPARDQGYPVC
jgi:hypothetical protein